MAEWKRTLSHAFSRSESQVRSREAKERGRAGIEERLASLELLFPGKTIGDLEVKLAGQWYGIEGIEGEAGTFKLDRQVELPSPRPEIKRQSHSKKFSILGVPLDELGESFRPKKKAKKEIK
jgi:hypothetical protein